MTKSMPHGQAHAIEIAEKVSSIFSVVGAFFIIGTFTCDRRFRKSINRLVFYASWGNLFANVATLISRAGIKLGVKTPLCQFQAFLIQWFMPADALWTFAMACNVYLTFFKQYDTAALRMLEWKYLIFCYGLPFIPALTFCFIETVERGKFYGSANLWCWVSAEWKVFRIATFYGPIWIIIITNVIIFIKVGTVVLKWRRKLLSMSAGIDVSSGATYHRQSSVPTATVLMNGMRSPTTTKTYEVSVVSQVPHHSPNRSKHLSLTSPTTPTFSHHTRLPSGQTTISEQPNVHRRTTIIHPVSQSGRPHVVDANRAAIAYWRTALLFFIALLVTWVPSTVNRLYTLISPGSPSPFALDFSSGLVLPLQGFWNTVIYIVTSLPAFKALLRDTRSAFSFNFRSNSSVSHSGNSGLPPNMIRHAAQLGSADTTDRDSNAHTKSTHLDDSKSSHTLIETRNPTKCESADQRPGSHRADIVISFDGKKRVIHHDYRSSVPDNKYNPFEKRDSYVHPQERSLQDEDEERDVGLTTLYRGAGSSRTSTNYDSSYEEVDLKDKKGDGEEWRGEGADSKTGFARRLASC